MQSTCLCGFHRTVELEFESLPLLKPGTQSSSTLDGWWLDPCLKTSSEGKPTFPPTKTVHFIVECFLLLGGSSLVLRKTARKGGCKQAPPCLQPEYTALGAAFLCCRKQAVSISHVAVAILTILEACHPCWLPRKAAGGGLSIENMTPSSWVCLFQSVNPKAVSTFVGSASS